MRKTFSTFFLFLAFSTSAHGQAQTAVTGTVTDPNAIPYANGTFSVQLIPTGTNPSVNGASIGGSFIGSTDVNGKFNLSLWPNASITPGGTQWQFTVCSNPGGIQPPFGTGGQCTPPTAITIAGTSQNVSATLNAVAPKLTNFLGGTVTAVTGTSPIVSSGGTTPAISCPTCSTISPTNKFQQIGIATSGTIPMSTVANQIMLWPFYVPNSVSTTTIAIDIGVADAGNAGDVGIVQQCDTAGSQTVVAHLGSTTFSSTGFQEKTWTGGAVTLTPGWYCIATANNANTATIAYDGVNAGRWMPFAADTASSTSATAGVIPGSVTVPTISWTHQVYLFGAIRQ